MIPSYLPPLWSNLLVIGRGRFAKTQSYILSNLKSLEALRVLSGRDYNKIEIILDKNSILFPL